MEECEITEDNQLENVSNIYEERYCQELCGTNSDCAYYTWYDNMAGVLANVCVLLSSCEERDSSCSSCHTAPVPCSHQMGPTSSPVSTTSTTSVPATDALIISGGEPDSVGNSVEVYVSSTGQHCHLPDLPGDPRDYHSMEGLMVCGGYYSTTRTSCLTLIERTWETTTNLIIERWYHSSWASPSGVRLLGGYNSSKTSERIQEDGTSVSGFALENPLYDSCSINLGQVVLLTGGGHYPFTSVFEYSETGHTRDLPQLLQSRRDHGCSYFENDEGTKTFLVTGGYITGWLSSTELLVETSNAWTLAGELPTPRSGLRGAKVDQRVIMTGGIDGHNYLDEILEFDPNTGEWSLLDLIMNARNGHAVSVISSAEINM